ncbi:HU family DNA-binding protein [bacterium]|nr:HU family DNA-binding protein [bacterium]NBW57754.1 HU family DNA-binding protein [bacterium]NBX72142.1 HU family DNA-binding protein [bacterium]
MSTKITKSDIVDRIASKLDMTKVQVLSVVNEVFDTVSENVAQGSKVSIAGFGIFESKSRQARKGRNPKTGEEITIEASVTPIFKAGESFKNRVTSKSE